MGVPMWQLKLFKKNIHMKNIQSFSIKRVLLLMQKTAYENIKFVLIGLVTVFGIFSIILFLNGLDEGDAWGKMQAFYVAGFIISGFFISGMAFTNLRTKEKTMSYLSLPASILEKFISELLLTTIGFIVIYTAIFYVFNFAVYLIGSPFNLDANIIDLFNTDVLMGYIYYVILQSIFLAGAATFKKAPLFFTTFSLFIVGVAITIFFVILALITKEHFESFEMTNMNFNGNPHDFEAEIENHFLIRFPKFMFYYLTAPIFWLVTYMKLKEKEA